MSRRNPQIGDLIIKRCSISNKKYMGLIYEIDSTGHGEHVHIAWSEDTKPQDYRLEHGYAGVNIHNLRQEFEIIRNGKRIP